MWDWNSACRARRGPGPGVSGPPPAPPLVDGAHGEETAAGAGRAGAHGADRRGAAAASPPERASRVSLPPSGTAARHSGREGWWRRPGPPGRVPAQDAWAPAPLVGLRGPRRT